MKEGKLVNSGKTINYKIIKRSKKNYILKIKDIDLIVLSIPKRLPYKYGEIFIKENKILILKKISEFEKKIEEIRPNGSFKIFGELAPDMSNDEFENFMENEGKNFLINEIEKWSGIIGVFPKKIRIRKLKSSWGICYSNGNITLNLNLIKMNPKIIEYVVVHELCHLLHHNHSINFWMEIEKYLPYYKDTRKVLKKEGIYY
jgi:predicted metal-dependent hydrolase